MQVSECAGGSRVGILLFVYIILLHRDGSKNKIKHMPAGGKSRSPPHEVLFAKIETIDVSRIRYGPRDQQETST